MEIQSPSTKQKILTEMEPLSSWTNRETAQWQFNYEGKFSSPFPYNQKHQIKMIFFLKTSSRFQKTHKKINKTPKTHWAGFFK